LWQQVMDLGGCWLVEVDIRKFFDTLDRGHLRALVRQRVRDGVLLRLIGKWLQAGVLEEGELTYPEAGTPQGGVMARRSGSVGGAARKGCADPAPGPRHCPRRPARGQANGYSAAE
jgi:hypothetical protein